MELFYSPRLRTEQLIIFGRIGLMAFSLLAVTLDPFNAQETAAVQLNRMIVGYLGYSILLAPMLLMAPLHVEKIGAVTHAVDVIFFTALVFLTNGFTSPFFAYFVFTLVCAALRWQEQGALWTSLVFLALFFAAGITVETIQNDNDLEINRFIFRSAYLVIIALFLVYLTSYEKNMRKEIGRLSEWPSKIDASEPMEDFIRNMLVNAALIMESPRTLMIWDEQEEPLRHIACLSPTGLTWRQIPPDSFAPIAAAHLDNRHFLCKNAADPDAKVLSTAGKGLEYGIGLTLHQGLIQTYAADRVIGLNLDGQKFQGRVLFLDKPEMIADDLTLGGLVAHQIAVLMDQFIAHKESQQSVVSEERIKMARDLHDGLLQTLTGIALQIETARRLLDKDARAAQKNLGELQKIIVDEQRSLRNFIEKLKPIAFNQENDIQTLQERLHKLAEIIQQQWRLKVVLILPPLGTLQQLPEDSYHLVREALINSARHAGGTEVQATVGIEAGYVRIEVSDNGCGFPFQGRYDLAELTAIRLGPKSLMERITALQGQLSIDSGANGSVIKISVPLSACKQPLALTADPGRTTLNGQNL